MDNTIQTVLQNYSCLGHEDKSQREQANLYFEELLHQPDAITTTQRMVADYEDINVRLLGAQLFTRKVEKDCLILSDEGKQELKEYAWNQMVTNHQYTPLVSTFSKAFTFLVCALTPIHGSFFSSLYTHITKMKDSFAHFKAVILVIESTPDAIKKLQMQRAEKQKIVKQLLLEEEVLCEIMLMGLLHEQTIDNTLDALEFWITLNFSVIKSARLTEELLKWFFSQDKGPQMLSCEIISDSLKMLAQKELVEEEDEALSEQSKVSLTMIGTTMTQIQPVFLDLLCNQTDMDTVNAIVSVLLPFASSFLSKINLSNDLTEVIIKMVVEIFREGEMQMSVETFGFFQAAIEASIKQQAWVSTFNLSLFLEIIFYRARHIEPELLAVTNENSDTVIQGVSYSLEDYRQELSQSLLPCLFTSLQAVKRTDYFFQFLALMMQNSEASFTFLDIEVSFFLVREILRFVKSEEEIFFTQSFLEYVLKQRAQLNGPFPLKVELSLLRMIQEWPDNISVMPHLLQQCLSCCLTDISTHVQLSKYATDSAVKLVRSVKSCLEESHVQKIFNFYINSIRPDRLYHGQLIRILLSCMHKLQSSSQIQVYFLELLKLLWQPVSVLLSDNPLTVVPLTLKAYSQMAVDIWNRAQFLDSDQVESSTAMVFNSLASIIVSKIQLEYFTCNDIAVPRSLLNSAMHLLQNATKPNIIQQLSIEPYVKLLFMTGNMLEMGHSELAMRGGLSLLKIAGRFLSLHQHPSVPQALVPYYTSALTQFFIESTPNPVDNFESCLTKQFFAFYSDLLRHNQTLQQQSQMSKQVLGLAIQCLNNLNVQPQAILFIRINRKFYLEHIQVLLQELLAAVPQMNDDSMREFSRLLLTLFKKPAYQQMTNALSELLSSDPLVSSLGSEYQGILVRLLAVTIMKQSVDDIVSGLEWIAKTSKRDTDLKDLIRGMIMEYETLTVKMAHFQH